MPDALTGVPIARLRHVVLSYQGYDARMHRRVEQRLPASGHLSLILGLGDPLDVVEMTNSASGGTHQSFVVGLHDGFALSQAAGHQWGVQVRLSPLTGPWLFGLPGRGLANELAPLDTVPRVELAHLPEQLAALPTWRERFALLDRTFLRWMARCPSPDPAIGHAWARLTDTRGQVPIAELVESSGRSHRWFTTRFAETVGLTPKRAAAILRFASARAQVQAGQPLAEVAARCGFSDQSHFTHEARRLAGCTPSLLRTS